MPSKIYPLSLLKCIGITFIVINHASGLGPNLHGGLNILAYITGFLFFSMLSQSCLKVTVSSFLKLTFKMLIISSIIIAFTYLFKKLLGFPIRTSFILEFFHLNNFFTSKRISSFPVWYVHCIVQIAILLFVISTIKPSFVLKEKRLFTIFIICFVTTIIPIIIVENFDILHLKNKTPDYILAYMIQGLILYKSTTTRVLLYSIICYLMFSINTYIMYIQFDYLENGISRFILSQIFFFIISHKGSFNFGRYINFFIHIISTNVLGVFFIHNFLITFGRHTLFMFDVNIYEIWYVIWFPILILSIIFSFTIIIIFRTFADYYNLYFISRRLKLK